MASFKWVLTKERKWWHNLWWHRPFSHRLLLLPYPFVGSESLSPAYTPLEGLTQGHEFQELGIIEGHLKIWLLDLLKDPPNWWAELWLYWHLLNHQSARTKCPGAQPNPFLFSQKAVSTPPLPLSSPSLGLRRQPVGSLFLLLPLL